MAFPTSSLTNNQVHKEGNRAFVYDSALGVWDQVRETDKTENEILQTRISNEATFPAGHIIQLKHFHYSSDLTLSSSDQSIPFIEYPSGRPVTNTGSLDFGCPITKIANSVIYVSGVVTHGFGNDTGNTKISGEYSDDAGSSWGQLPINGGVGDFFHEMHHGFGDADVRHPTWVVPFSTILGPSEIGSVAVTVYVKIQSRASSGTNYINRGQSNSETDNTTLTLMEVAT